MKQYFLIFIIVFTTLVVTASNKNDKSTNENLKDRTFYISGTINDLNTGETLAGVEVKIEGTDYKTYTDFDGNFNFTDLKQGKYKLVANYISYKPVTHTFSSEACKNTLKINMENKK